MIHVPPPRRQLSQSLTGDNVALETPGWHKDADPGQPSLCLASDSFPGWRVPWTVLKPGPTRKVGSLRLALCPQHVPLTVRPLSHYLIGLRHSCLCPRAEPDSILQGSLGPAGTLQHLLRWPSLLEPVGEPQGPHLPGQSDISSSRF